MILNPPIPQGYSSGGVARKNCSANGVSVCIVAYVWDGPYYTSVIGSLLIMQFR
jgi:hypothetical protein